ncbi:GNAT family N-acetyltransferase [Candidatus Gribaldobacteria bacterium]|nr:GNAT family N-acetyltransferase [Candidatus Gribaldobacteria bacterium]
MEIELKRATLKDAEFLFDLRNDPLAFKWFSNPNPVAWQDHLQWLNDILQGKLKKYLFIIEFGEERIGQFRLDEINKAKAIINISLSQKQRGKGLGSLALQKGIKLANDLGFKELRAEVHQDNLASIGLFQKMGFIFQSQKDIWKTLTLKLQRADL